MCILHTTTTTTTAPLPTCLPHTDRHGTPPKQGMSKAARDSSRCATWLRTPSSSFGASTCCPPIHSHLRAPNRQPGQTSTGEVARRDLRAELLAAEEEARNKKRKAEGKPTTAGAITAGTNGPADEDAIKRRKLLQEALELDKDDDGDEDQRGDVEDEAQNDKEKDADAEESEEESDEDEDDTDELLRELEKIKRERAEEQARQEREQLVSQAAQLESPGLNTTVPGTFSVKRRWDDGACFVAAWANDIDRVTNYARSHIQESSYEPKGKVGPVCQ